jgi:hypothetical protein
VRSDGDQADAEGIIMRRGQALVKAVYDRAFQRMMFEGRGLSKQTIEALIDAGIDMPERLFFMDAKAISSLQGVGTTKIKEIEAYRATYKTVKVIVTVDRPEPMPKKVTVQVA